jgi:hypothetical protein
MLTKTSGKIPGIKKYFTVLRLIVAEGIRRNHCFCNFVIYMPAVDILSSGRIEYENGTLGICVVLKKTQHMKAIPKSEFPGQGNEVLSGKLYKLVQSSPNVIAG